jgi:hypothetical protein
VDLFDTVQSALLRQNEHDDDLSASADTYATYSRETHAVSTADRTHETLTENTRYTIEGPVSVGPSNVEKHITTASKILGLFPTDTVYSASQSSTAPHPHSQKYIAELGKDLFGAIASFELDREGLEYISATLPDLLRAFALQLGHQAPTQLHCEISYFVYKHRQ